MSDCVSQMLTSFTRCFITFQPNNSVIPQPSQTNVSKPWQWIPQLVLTALTCIVTKILPYSMIQKSITYVAVQVWLLSDWKYTSSWLFFITKFTCICILQVLYTVSLAFILQAFVYKVQLDISVFRIRPNEDDGFGKLIITWCY